MLCLHQRVAGGRTTSVSEVEVKVDVLFGSSRRPPGGPCRNRLAPRMALKQPLPRTICTGGWGSFEDGMMVKSDEASF